MKNSKYSSISLLLIEDNPVVTEAVKKLLNRVFNDIKILHTDLLSKAIQYIENLKFDIILTDLELPDSKAEETVATLIHHIKDEPVIVLSGSTEEEIALNTLSQGAQDYILKAELDADRLRRTIIYALERQALLRQLKFKNTLFAQYFKVTGVLMVGLDSAGKVTLINTTACKTIGVREEDIIGKNWFELYIPSYIRPKVLDVFYKLIQGNEIEAEFLENPIVTNSGEERIILWHNTVVKIDGEIVGTLSSGLDVTEERKAKKALEESERNFRTVLEIGPEAWIIVDENNQVLFMNSFAQSLKLSQIKLNEICNVNNNSTIKIEDNSYIKFFDVVSKNIIWNNSPARLVSLRDITEIRRYTIELENLVKELKKSREEIKTLQGLLPICVHCKKIRDDKGYWHTVESYLSSHTEAELTHGYCPECAQRILDQIEKNNDVDTI